MQFMAYSILHVPDSKCEKHVGMQLFDVMCVAHLSSFFFFFSSLAAIQITVLLLVLFQFQFQTLNPLQLLAQ